MADYRSKVYDKYISSFKGQRAEYEQHAHRYWRWCDHRIKPIIKDLPRNSSVLDLGCGSGLMVEYLLRQGFEQVSGVDVSKEQVALAQDRKLPVELGDARTCLEAGVNEYDLIVALDFVEHFTKDELLVLVPQIHDSLRPCGKLLIQTPNGSGLMSGHVIYGDLTHNTIFTPHSLTNLLKLYHFDDIKFFETRPAPIGSWGGLRLVLWHVIRLIAKATYRIQTGRTQDIWTQNLICYCEKPAKDEVNTGQT